MIPKNCFFKLFDSSPRIVRIREALRLLTTVVRGLEWFIPPLAPVMDRIPLRLPWAAGLLLDGYDLYPLNAAAQHLRLRAIWL